MRKSPSSSRQRSITMSRSVGTRPVAAGSAMAVDRDVLSAEVERELSALPNVQMPGINGFETAALAERNRVTLGVDR